MSGGILKNSAMKTTDLKTENDNNSKSLKYLQGSPRLRNLNEFVLIFGVGMNGFHCKKIRFQLKHCGILLEC